jgi:hypothetical protein
LPWLHDSFLFHEKVKDVGLCRGVLEQRGLLSKAGSGLHHLGRNAHDAEKILATVASKAQRFVVLPQGPLALRTRIIWHGRTPRERVE